HAYNEANTKKDFIRPLFEALGWRFEGQDEVSEEHPVGSGRADYLFRIGGVSRFYLEAKSLRHDLASQPKWETQAVSYAYSKSISWAVLTNFKELWLFAASEHGRRPFINLTLNEYLTDFEKLWLLSKESLESGLLDAEARKLGVVPPSTPVERRLFQQLRVWREKLFTNIHGYRPDLNFAQVDETIQMLFNRLIFIRTCEDRALEDPVLMPMLRQHLDAHRRGRPLVEELRRAFRQFDGYYDSELFALHLVDQTEMDDDLLEEVLKGLYTVPGGTAEYDFSAIDADILGRVYEMYLGHVAQVAARRHRELQLMFERGFTTEQALQEVVQVVEAPQRRKEHGIYYTPKWVTDYIVRQTVGRFIEEHEKRPDAIHEIRILDPACGSGSFLIRAYDELLRWHARSSGRPEAHVFADERLPILHNNIYGVDLDRQAVEIARLNLLLRALAKRERLPTLADNVKRGNSLVSGGEAELKPYFGDKWHEKQPFDWEREFPDATKDSGFDVVIGNPPYVRIQSLDRAEADYYRDHYESAYGSFDIYVPFIERGLKLLKPGGRLGYITSGKFLKAQYGKKLQELLMREATVDAIVDLSAQEVFAEATTYPAIIILRKGASRSSLKYVPVSVDVQPEMGTQLDALPATAVPQTAIKGGVWPPPVGETKVLMGKLTKQSVPLGSLSKHVFQGLITSADGVYILDKRRDGSSGNVFAYSRALDREVEMESAPLKPLLSGKHIDRYVALETRQLLLFPYEVHAGQAALIDAGRFSRDYTLCWAYLQANQKRLEDREGGKMRHERWYAYVYPKNLALHDIPKLAVPRLVHRLQAYYDRDGERYLDNVDVGGLILKEATDASYGYVLGLLNSKLLDWYFRQISVPFRGGFRSANRQYLEPLPIRRIDFSNKDDKAQYDRLVKLVEEMLALQARLAPLRSIPSSERADVEHAIALKDREIDGAVYDLYGLTKAERALVSDASEQSPRPKPGPRRLA
ncbi:MAG: N-6 DNA methylase, partial [Chloroflexota bacterium]|nr:N-6 DNA methylase [Chloroflexota bacterium]